MAGPTLSLLLATSLFTDTDQVDLLRRVFQAVGFETERNGSE